MVILPRLVAGAPARRTEALRSGRPAGASRGRAADRSAQAARSLRLRIGTPAGRGSTGVTSGRSRDAELAADPGHVHQRGAATVGLAVVAPFHVVEFHLQLASQAGVAGRAAAPGRIAEMAPSRCHPGPAVMVRASPQG